MMKKVLIVFFSLSALAVAGVVAVQLSGVWQLSFSAVVSGEEVPCVYQGTITVNETMLGGTSTVNLQSGPDACPDQLTANITSLSADGSSISGTLDGGQEFGTVQFEGNVFLDMQMLNEKAEVQNDASGSFVIDSGPFSDTEGSWSAQFQGPLSQIPLLSPVGLLIMASLLVLTAFYLHRRQRVPTR